jgi:rhodanese-related sulfurtransferase
MMANPGRIPFEPIDAVTLAERLAAGEMLQLIDVREPEEVAIAAIQGFEILPLSQFAEWSPQIHSRFEADKETIVMCHHGMRSAQMCYWLAQNGFTRLKNLEGGIDAYAVMVDPLINRY